VTSFYFELDKLSGDLRERVQRYLQQSSARYATPHNEKMRFPARFSGKKVFSHLGRAINDRKSKLGVEM
jgi:hypothetical protein